MRKTCSSNDGFSLTEVLLAVGIIAVGMLFIAGVFPVGIHFTTIASERTIAAVVANEAFAKIRLYGVNLAFLSYTDCNDFRNASPMSLPPGEFAYPSDRNIDISDKQFYWSALCRRVVDPDPNSQLVQVTVFVSRKVGSGTTYQDQGLPGNWPVPVPVAVSGVFGAKELTITNPPERTFINDGYIIVGHEFGRIYRVLERYAENPATPVPDDQIILLDLDQVWGPGNVPPNMVWVVPPPIGGGRYPVIAIYQRVIRF